jgi:hypothetical protein
MRALSAVWRRSCAGDPPSCDIMLAGIKLVIRPLRLRLSCSYHHVHHSHHVVMLPSPSAGSCPAPAGNCPSFRQGGEAKRGRSRGKGSILAGGGEELHDDRVRPHEHTCKAAMGRRFGIDNWCNACILGFCNTGDFPNLGPCSRCSALTLSMRLLCQPFSELQKHGGGCATYAGVDSLLS